MHGARPYREVPELYRRATLLVNASLTGSVDKVVLEAMACERPVLTCNESFEHVFRSLGADAERLVFAPGDGAGLAARISALLDSGAAERAALGTRLRRIVAAEHEVDALMARLVDVMAGNPMSAAAGVPT